MTSAAAITEIPLSVELMRRHDLSRVECEVHGVIVAYARLNTRPTLNQIVEVMYPAKRAVPSVLRDRAYRHIRRVVARLRQLELIAVDHVARNGAPHPPPSRYRPTMAEPATLKRIAV